MAARSSTSATASRSPPRPIASAEFRLRPDVASAAVRTPDVGASDRGPEWVTFSPPSLDRFALDRLTAWFEFAWRHATD